MLAILENDREFKISVTMSTNELFVQLASFPSYFNSKFKKKILIYFIF
jgi:hypothetical protein